MHSHKTRRFASETSEIERQSPARPEPREAANRNRPIEHIVVAIESGNPPKGCRGAPLRAAKPDKNKKRDALAIVAAKRIRDINIALAHLYGGRVEDHNARALGEVVSGLFVKLDGWPQNFAKWLSSHAPSITRADAAAIADDAREGAQTYCPWLVGRLLRLGEIDRKRLKITHVKPNDLSPSEVELSRIATKRLRDEQRRRAAGQTRRRTAEELKQALDSEGISLRTYRRREAKRREAEMALENARYIKESKTQRFQVPIPISLSDGGALEARPPKVLSRTEGRAALFAAAIRALDVSLIPRAA